MEKIRAGLNLAGLERTEDYSQGLYDLPKSDVIKLYFSNGSWAAIRPSGTEPKIKLYIGTQGLTPSTAQVTLEEMEKMLLPILES
jgi:phosphoglucomutase